ncbi:hypothetical protein RvY_03093 [Ramazzottius varieornatus]|uniref:Uncharacterized protein n=1 Tax=Ramazzottius varieornatus TaxID=947166 RepID=A0A1D1UQN9_RAMVA|nr:hypothetical protein RvY_03093 [Ramazzottius varieornatus]
MDSEANLAVAKWSLLTTGEPLLPDLRRQQKVWDTPLFKNIRENLTRMQVSGSTRFLPPLSNLLDNNVLRISVGLRLGAKLCRPHTCRCGANVDEYGQHGLSCKFSESFKRALTSAHSPAILEPPGIFKKDKRRPDGMTQVPWKNGEELVRDVTMVNTLALTNFAMSMAKAGSAADAAERRRITK